MQLGMHDLDIAAVPANQWQIISTLLSTTMLYLLAGNTLVLVHAVLKTPNLKTRLTSAREEFRAVW